MGKKISQILTIVIFLTIFGLVFGEQYWSFHGQNNIQKEYLEKVSHDGSTFSGTKLVSFGENIEFLYTPNLDLLDALVKEIDAAQDKVYVEVYIFTESRLRDALIGAHKRGVDVKILLENNPYKAPYLNDKHYSAFKNEGIDVRWSDPLNYSLNHAKLLMIDEKTYISTGNFSYSLFKYNRDFLVQITEDVFSKKIEELFLQDYTHKKIGVLHPNLVLSPDYSRSKIQSLVEGARESIDFYFPYMADDDFQEVLFMSAQKGVQIRGIVEKDFYNENTDVINNFKDYNIDLTALQKPKLHAKAVLADKKYLYIGSINFSRYSFDENREIGIVLDDKNVISEFQKVFESDL